MADLTKCSGEGCPIKDTCHRFTVQANPDRQSFFSKPPGVYDGEDFFCSMFWGNNHQLIYENMIRIAKGETMDKS